MEGTLVRKNFIKAEEAFKTVRQMEAENKANMDDFRLILEDLRSGLDCLSSEMTKAQAECDSVDSSSHELEGFEGTLQKLGMYNDMLETELLRTIKEKDGAIDDLRQNTEHFKAKVMRLKSILKEKDEVIQRMNEQLQKESNQLCCAHECTSPGTSQTRGSAQPDATIQSLLIELEMLRGHNYELKAQNEETARRENILKNDLNKLNEELNFYKRRTKEMSEKLQKFQNLLKLQEDSRMELLRKCEEIDRNYENQSKRLREVSLQYERLQQTFNNSESERNQDAAEIEKLRGDLYLAREKHASLVGRKKTMEAHLKESENTIHELHKTMEREQNAHRRSKDQADKIIADLQATNVILKRNLSSLHKDYSELKDEEAALRANLEESKGLIENYRQFKDAQRKADASTRASLDKHNEHIKLLLDERQKFLEDYRSLHRECSVLQNELDRLKMCRTARPGNSLSNSIDYEIENSRDLNRRVADLRQTTGRMAALLEEANSEPRPPDSNPNS